MWKTALLQPVANQIVSTLLKSINDIIILQGSNTELTDYVVEVGGIEVLHFHKMSAVFKEDEEVV
jgi:hypothetical protein